jgi:AcrR family transcriptional regulator
MKEKGRAVPQKAKTSRSEQKETTREQILEAATTLLAEHGYAALRVAAVASKAGVSLGGQLHHFPSKDDLVVAVLERLSARISDSLQQDATRTGMAEDILLAISNSAQRFYASPEFVIYLDIFLSVRHHALLGDAAVRLLQSQRTTTEALWLPHLTQQGYAMDHALLIIRALWGLARGLAISSSAEQRHSGNPKTVDFVVHALQSTYPPVNA